MRDGEKPTGRESHHRVEDAAVLEPDRERMRRAVGESSDGHSPPVDPAAPPGLCERAIDGLEITIRSVEGAPRASKGRWCEQDETGLVPRFPEDEEPLPGRTARAVEGEDEPSRALARPRRDAQARPSSVPQAERIFARRAAAAALGLRKANPVFLRCAAKSRNIAPKLSVGAAAPREDARDHRQRCRERTR